MYISEFFKKQTDRQRWNRWVQQVSIIKVLNEIKVVIQAELPTFQSQQEVILQSVFCHMSLKCSLSDQI